MPKKSLKELYGNAAMHLASVWDELGFEKPSKTPQPPTNSELQSKSKTRRSTKLPTRNSSSSETG